MADQTVTIKMPDVTTPVTSTPTAGFKSTEFGATVLAGLALSSGAIPAQYAPLVAAVAGVYVACRTLLKAAHALGYAKAIPDLPAIPPLAQGQTSTTVTTVQGTTP